MKIHPITIMVLLLLSSNIHGVLGMIVAIPTYSILKEIAKFLANRYDNHKKTTTAKLVAAKALSSHFFFLIESICSGKTKEEKELAKISYSL